jgi:hypothetical protein
LPLGYKTGGRKVGTPNRVTAETRQVIAYVVDQNIDKLSEWLISVAEGVKVKKVDSSMNERDEYIVPPNPAKAFFLLHSLLEFHIPKLGRLEVAKEAECLDSSANLGVFNELLLNLKKERQLNDY